MDGGDVRVGGKKKRPKPVEIGFDSDDDEPIGSLFKMRKSRGSKKKVGNVASEGSCGNKGKNVDAVARKLVDAKDDLVGGMDDTLASFRKRLKGSGATRATSSVLNATMESSDRSLNLSVDGIEGHVVSDDDVVACGSGRAFKDEKEVNLSLGDHLQHNSDENMEDSLSAIFRKAQSSSVRKSRVLSCSKKKKESHNGDNNKRGDGCFLEEVTEGICHSNILDVCNEDRHHLSSIRSENFCAASDQERIPNDALKQCSSMSYDDEMIDNGSLSKVVEGVSGFTKSELKNKLADELDPVCNFGSEHRHTEPLVKSTGNILNENNYMVTGKAFCGGQVEVDKAVKCETEAVPDKDRCDCNGLNRKPGVKDLVLGTSLEKNDVTASGSLSPKMSVEANEYELDVLSNQLEKPLEVYNSPKEYNASILKCSSMLDPVQSDGSSLPSAPDENENNGEYNESLSDFANKDSKIRAVRKAKMHKHGDMTYEGDADWENLTNDQALNENHAAEDSESVAVVAVSAGLRAHAAGPLEKIKFKEILKRKGGLKEYLACRNQILRLWSRDVTRVLPLAECGVSDAHSEDKSPRSSLIREVYTFLDQCGYINIGIASQKENVGSSAMHSYKLVKKKGFEESSAASIADSEEGVSFIVGQTKMSDVSMENNHGIKREDEDIPAEATEGRMLVDAETVNLLNTKQPKEGENFDSRDNDDIQEGLSGTRHVNINNFVPSSELPDCRLASVVATEQSNESICVKTGSVDQIGDKMLTDLEGRKRVIVIGAGPSGLTAARHLQRQGLAVTADVATERRPDPSSLICSQLGLELTVLNSDCPLYDIMTGQKVPADMDEALEAEYNSLLDGMELLVAQKGEQAMRMSLEDGLEYALKIRRMAHAGSIEELEQVNSGDSPSDSKRVSTVEQKFEQDILSPLERRVMDWHYAHLEYGCAASLAEVSLPNWNQDDVYGGFGGAHCMIKGGYSAVVESLAEGLPVHLNHVVTNVSYGIQESGCCNKVKVSTSDGSEFFGDAVLVTVPLGCLKAETIQFSPPLPEWKYSAVQRLGYGVLNKVVLEFPSVFWDDAVDYFGATAEERGKRGHCFMFWNVRKTVGAPVLIALVVGKAAIDGQNLSSSDHVEHALKVLRKLFGETSVPDPVAHVVTDWGRDPFSFGAYSYVAIGASGEDYDLLGRPIDNCLFFSGEATCKEHPDTVGGAMMTGLREAVRIIDILSSGNDYTAEVEAMEAAQRQLDTERDEVREITKKLNAVELSSLLYKNSLDGAQVVTREALLREMFFTAKTSAGRLHVAKQLLSLPLGKWKSFAGSRQGLTVLNSWILDSMGKDGTQLLRHCVRLLVRVSTDLLAVRVSGIGKTVKEKVCVHTSRDIRAIASQLVNVWLEVFRKEKASNGGLKLSRQAAAVDLSKRKPLKDSSSGKPPLSTQHGVLENKGGLLNPVSAGSNSQVRKLHSKQGKQQASNDSRHDVSSSRSQGSIEKAAVEEDNYYVLTEEERAAIAAAEEARAKAHAAAQAYASAEARCSTLLQLPKIPSFHKFARKEHDECDSRRKWSGGVLGRQDCISEIDSRNCRVREWSVDFSAACVNLDNSRMSVDNLSQRSHSNEIASHLNFREHSGESVAAADSSLYTKAWIDTTSGVGIKDSYAIERWQSQAAAADSCFSHPTIHMDEEDSNAHSRLSSRKRDGLANESSISQVTVNKEALKGHHRGADHIKQAVVDYVASLLMPLYKARKLDKDGYKAIMKKSATKVMEAATDAEKAMIVHEFLDFKRKNKIRSFVDTLIERHMAAKSNAKS
ncbi:hypothetical protein PIB30_048112 [Stylosanthes scabra]|uniref:SWIRM domain-containing protein n=1 Tax=Stylosanthes scabra TaxID=79078 RepID=A0ABU6YFR2_9FABA|nr:hypothetical protein [Stylosanthes scabra]